MYGGLGKVGLDHDGKFPKDENGEELCPGFSASALKYVKNIVEEEDVSEIEEFLVEGLENMDD